MLDKSLTSHVSCASDDFSFHSVFLFLCSLSLDESDSLDDESDELVSDSKSSGTYCFRAFSFIFDKSVVIILGSDVFAPT